MIIIFKSAAGQTAFSVELKNPGPFGWKTPAGTRTLLQTGYYGVQLSTVNPFERSFLCQTDKLADITALEGVKSEFGDLVIDGVTACTHVGITGTISVIPFGPRSYQYAVTFTQAI